MKAHYNILTLLLCVYASAAVAQHRIPDLSMSPEESLQQPDISNDRPSAAAPDVSVRSDPSAAAPLQDALPLTFMERFCDPGFRPLLSNNQQLVGMTSCLEEHRKNACTTFFHLPADARGVLDHAIACRYAAEEDGRPSREDCGDGERLHLIEKYWREHDISHALVFLPDEALDGSDCVRHR